jgi:hypothetical protein
MCELEDENNYKFNSAMFDMSYHTFGVLQSYRFMMTEVLRLFEVSRTKPYQNEVLD